MTTTITSAPDPGTFTTIEQAQEARAIASARARRRKFLLWSAPVVALVAIVAFYLIGLAIVVMVGERSYANQSYASALNQFSWTHRVNVVEKWKPWFNTGTSRYSSGAFFTATQDLEDAMELVPRAADGEPRTFEECLVAQNLSLSYEGLGDEAARAEDSEMAISYYDQALATLEGCGSSGGGGDSEQEQEQESEADSTEERQQDKQDEQQQQQEEPADGEGDPEEGEDPADPEEGEGEEEPTPEPTTSDQQQELEQRNEDAQEQTEQEQGQEAGGTGGGQGW